jgi:hypothetical protein
MSNRRTVIVSTQSFLFGCKGILTNHPIGGFYVCSFPGRRMFIYACKPWSFQAKIRLLTCEIELILFDKEHICLLIKYSLFNPSENGAQFFPRKHGCPDPSNPMTI